MYAALRAARRKTEEMGIGAAVVNGKQDVCWRECAVHEAEGYQPP